MIPLPIDTDRLPPSLPASKSDLPLTLSEGDEPEELFRKLFLERTSSPAIDWLCVELVGSPARLLDGAPKPVL